MSVLDTIESDLKSAGAWLESQLETEATAAWGLVKQVFVAAEPGAVAILKAGIEEAIADLGVGAPFGDIMTGVLNTLESQGATWIKDIEANLLQGIVSLGVSAAVTAAPATTTDTAETAANNNAPGT